MKNRLIVIGILFMALISCQPIDSGPKADLDVKCGSYPVFIPVNMEGIDRKSIVWALEGAGSLLPLTDGNVRYKLPSDCSSRLGSTVTVKAAFQNASEQYVLKLAPRALVKPVVCVGLKCFSIDITGRPLNDLYSPENLKQLDETLEEYLKKNPGFIDKDGWLWIYNNGSLYVYTGGLTELGSNLLNDEHRVTIGSFSGSAIDSNGDLVVLGNNGAPSNEIIARRYFRPYLRYASSPENFEELNTKVVFKATNTESISSLKFDTNNNAILTLLSVSGTIDKRFYYSHVAFDSQFVQQNLSFTGAEVNYSRNFTPGPDGDFWNVTNLYIERWKRDPNSGFGLKSKFPLTGGCCGAKVFDQDGDLWTFGSSIDNSGASPIDYSELSEYKLSSSGTVDSLTLKSRVKIPGYSLPLQFYGF